MSKKKVRDAIYSHWEVAPVSIEQIIKDSGIVLKDQAKLDDGISGQLKKLDSGGFEISVNGKESYHRRRFTMAHELGHYYLHKSLVGRGTDDDRMYRSTAEGGFYNTQIEKKHESEANSFAAFILMPEHLVREEVDKRGTPVAREFVQELAVKLQVSVEALLIRLKSLKIPVQPE